jgi:hypothetical protein
VSYPAKTGNRILNSPYILPEVKVETNNERPKKSFQIPFTHFKIDLRSTCLTLVMKLPLDDERGVS